MSFEIQKDSVFAVPILHYNMETAEAVRASFEKIQPDCVAVEFPENMQSAFLQATGRLPDISVIGAESEQGRHLYTLVEPCDGCFEALRCALEHNRPAFCIDLDVDKYPDRKDYLPDPYSIYKIGLQHYYAAYIKAPQQKYSLDIKRELHMARKLKELSLSYERILFIGGMFHVAAVLDLMDQNSFPIYEHAARSHIGVYTLTEPSCREVLSECGYVSKHYEENRRGPPLDRQKLLYNLYKEAAKNYTLTQEEEFPNYHFRNMMRFGRNYAYITGGLLPDFYQMLTVAKGCVNHNYAYEVWELATDYPHHKNIDSIDVIDLSLEDLWGKHKKIIFHLKEKKNKGRQIQKRDKDRSSFRFRLSPFYGICSYPPEDIVVESFGNFLQKKGKQILLEEGASTTAFSTSLEDGLDVRETIRHWPQKKLYVKIHGKPSGAVGSVVVIFDPDTPKEGQPFQEKYPWKVSWLGEHSQESDMAFYASAFGVDLVGPGICRCRYGGFMLSYPPLRLGNIWTDPDYRGCKDKQEVLLMAAIDYAEEPVIVFVSLTAPPLYLKRYAARQGKKIAYLPQGQLSPLRLQRLQTFHVLDGKDKREIAEDYI